MLVLRLILLTALLLPPMAHATDDWTLSGFASLGAGRISRDKISYMDYTSEKWSFRSDSVLGLHVTGDLADRLSLTAQAVSRGFSWDDTKSFEPELDWLFLRYQLSSEWRLRAGRMRTPHYLFSDSIEVGYSYAWVRPPVDVYAPILSPFSNFDGLDLTYITDWNDMAIDIQLLGGYMKRSREVIEIKVEPTLGGNISLQQGDFLLRYGLMYNRTDIQVSSYSEATAIYQQAGSIDPVFNRIAHTLSADNNWYRYQTLGLRWEHQALTLLGEVFDIRNTDDGYTNNADGWYLSAQYRIGRFTPYLVAGAFRDDFNQKTLDFIVTSYNVIPAGFNAELDDLRDLSVQAISGLTYKQNSWTAGLRYDLLSNLALKAEYQWFEFRNGTSGQFAQETRNPPDSSAMVTFAVDVVF